MLGKTNGPGDCHIILELTGGNEETHEEVLVPTLFVLFFVGLVCLLVLCPTADQPHDCACKIVALLPLQLAISLADV